MGRLPHFLSYGALSRGWSSAIIIINNIIIIIIIVQQDRNTSRLYIHDLIMGALTTGHSGQLGIQNNAMICLSDHKTIDSLCPITNTKSNLYWISYIYSWLPVGSRSDVINCRWRRVVLRFPSNRTSTRCTKKICFIHERQTWSFILRDKKKLLLVNCTRFSSCKLLGTVNCTTPSARDFATVFR